MDTALQNFRTMMDEADEKMGNAIDQLPLNENRDTNFLKRSQQPFNFFLIFNNWSWERTFTTQVDPLFKLYMMGVLTTLFATATILLILFHELLLWFWLVWGVATSVVVMATFYLWATSVRRIFLLDENSWLVRRFWLPLERSRESFTMRTLIFFITTVAIVLCVLVDLTNIGTELKNKHEDLFEILEDDPLAFVDVDEVYVQTDPLSLIWYFTYCCALSMTVAFGFYHVHFLLKLSIYLAAFVSYAVVIAPLMTYLCEATDDCSSCNCKHSLANTSYLTHLLYLFSIVLVLHATDRQIEFIRRMDYAWQCRLKDELGEADTTRKVNKLLLLNILPMHVANIYLDTRRSNDQLFNEKYQSVAVMFASIPNFMDFYAQSEARDGGINGLEVLNEIISGFDELLFEARFTRVEKIKIVGSTYMAACGLASSSLSTGYQSDDDESLIKTIVNFAATMRNVLERLNRAKSQTFRLRTGIHEGPVIAGVVGAQKPLYDIWGNTVNVASRLDYSGELGRIQVTEKIAHQLRDEGVACSLRGETYLKGVGDVRTYWVHAESLATSPAEASGADCEVVEMPRRKSFLFPASELQEVIVEEEEPPEEEPLPGGSATIDIDYVYETTEL